MARVILVSDTVNDAVLQLVVGLHQQRQDLLLVTGQSERGSLLDGLRSHIQVITPFGKWTAMEVLRSLPPMTQFNPDVWHFIYADGERRPTLAHWMLSTYARTLPNQVLVASLLHEKLWPSTWQRAHLQLFDAITFSTRIEMLKFRREKGLPKHCLTEVLMPAPASRLFSLEGRQFQKHIRHDLKDLTQALNPFIFFAGTLAPNQLRELDELAGLVHTPRFLMQGDRKRNFENLHFAPNLSFSEIGFVAEKARGIVTSFADFSLEELRFFWSLANQENVPLLVHPEQAERAPGLCLQGKTGWILQQETQSLRELLLENPTLVLKKEPNLSRHDFSDQSFNQLVRLYHKAYEKRWS